MKASFEFDGDRLHIRLSVEGETEVAIARLMETFSSASVSLDRGRYGDYGYGWREREPKAVDIILRRPPPPAVPEELMDKFPPRSEA
jgi:hypothetical protein